MATISVKGLPQTLSPAIYMIRNIINNKIYIGSAKDFKTRMYKHKSQLRRNIHHSQHLQRAYNKYGKESFSFEIFEYVKDIDKLIEREQVWLDFFKPEYNSYKIAYSPLGHKCSNETKQKMSISNKLWHKNNIQIHTDEVKQKIIITS